MSQLHVLSLRDLLLQHLLLEHEVAHHPEGGLQPEVKEALRRLANDCDVQVKDHQPQAQTHVNRPLQLLLKPLQNDEAKPLVALSGILTSRLNSQGVCFKAVSVHLGTPQAETPDGVLEHVQRALRLLSHPASLIGIWA